MNCKIVMIDCKAQILSVSRVRLNNEIQDRRLHLQNIERIGKKFTRRDTCSTDNFVQKQRVNAVGQNGT